MKLQKYKRDSRVSYAMGATLAAELLKTHRNAITRVFLRPVEKHGEDLAKIIEKLKSKNIEIIESTKAFNILGAKDNCLLMAEFEKESANSVLNCPNEIILVNPSDSGNLGTIMRSAVAFGFNKMTIVLPGIDPYDPKVIRASMGAVFHLEIVVTESVEELDNTLSGAFAFILDKSAKPLESINPDQSTDDISLVFGNEAAGLPKDFCEKTGATPVYIQQSENVDSLNLGVAASIAMHWFKR